MTRKCNKETLEKKSTINFEMSNMNLDFSLLNKYFPRQK